MGMMKRFLNARRGASMIIALLLVLVCTVVSVVITTSSSVSVERTRQYLKEQQAYYAVRSAMDYAEDVVSYDQGPSGEGSQELRGAGPIASTELTCAQGATSWEFSQQPAAGSDQNNLSGWARDQANAILQGHPDRAGDAGAIKLDIPSFKAGDAEVPATTLTLTMGNGKGDGEGGAYTITVTAALADVAEAGDGSNDGDYAYTLTETFPIDSEVSQPDSSGNNQRRLRWVSETSVREMRGEQAS